MEYHIVNQDNLAAITDMEELTFGQILKGEGAIPESDENLLGDIVVFKMVVGNEVSDNWYIGRLSPSDPKVEPIKLSNIKHSLYHRFPSTSYLYFSYEGPLSGLEGKIDELDDIRDFSIIYPPILVFPDGIPDSNQDDVKIDIWLATSGKEGEEEFLVEKAKVNRSYSYNYVNSMLDFTNLPEFQN